ncbi:TPA: fimbrial protein [Escherichia coli]|nr:fimbrial protein [Escherichia coli]
MMLMWSSQTYAEGALSDSLEKSITINFSVNVKVPTCRIEVPDVVDFGEPRVPVVSRRGVDRNFTITLKSCTGRVPKPGLVFSGEYIDDLGMYIKNKSGSDYAKGVGIRLNFRGKEFKLTDGVILDEVGTSGPKSFSFSAHLGKEGGEEVTAGKVDTTVTLSMTYN